MFAINDILKAMEKMYEPQEEAFEIAKVIYNLQKTCPVHHIGVKNLKLQGYVCPICDLPLAKTHK